MAIGKAGLNNGSAGLQLGTGLGGANLVALGVSAALQDLALFYDFSKNPDLNAETIGGITYGPTLGITRATEARVTDWENVIRTAQSGEARFTGARRVGNYVIGSTDLSAAGDWTDSTTNRVGSITDPFGGTTATHLRANSGAGSHQMNSNAGPDPVTGIHQITWSCYCKAAEWNFVGMYIAGPNDGKMFNLGDGTIGNNITAEPAAFSIESIGDGWYRCSVTATATDTTPNVRIYVSDTDSASSTGAAGSDEGVHIYGAQVEITSGQADPAPSEYQATTTAAVAKWYATKRRTNLLQQSNTFAAPWSTSSVVETPNFATAPDGTTTATQFKDNSAGGSGATVASFASSSMPPIIVGEQYTFSVHLKAEGLDWALVDFEGFGAARQMYVDMANGVLGTITGSPDATSITGAGSGWYRVSITQTMTSDVAGLVAIYVAEANGDFSVPRDGTSTILVWGAQLETGSVATAYIPTTAASASSSFDTDLTPDGLLIEEARTNICKQSENFDTTWTDGAGSITTADQAVAPDGTLTADEVIGDGGGTGSVVTFQNVSALTVDTVWTLSIFAKASALDWLHLDLSSIGVKDYEAYFDLTDGVVGATTGADVTSTNMEDVGDGWYRCSITFTSDASDVAGNIIVGVAEADNDATVTRDSTSSIYAWGCQLEAGAFPTSYIPTVASSVTRNVDAVSTTDVSWWVDKNDGTWYGKTTQFGLGTGSNIDPIIFNLQFNTTNYIMMGSINRSTSLLSRVDGGSDGSTTTNSIGTMVSGVQFQAAMRLSKDDCRGYLDGVQGAQDTTFDLTGHTAFNTFYLHRDFVGQTTTQTLSEVRYYKVAKNDTFLEDISNGLHPL